MGNNHFFIFRQIAERFKLDLEAALENVLYIRAYTSEHQHEILGMIILDIRLNYEQ